MASPSGFLNSWRNYYHIMDVPDKLPDAATDREEFELLRWTPTMAKATSIDVHGVIELEDVGRMRGFVYTESSTASGADYPKFQEWKPVLTSKVTGVVASSAPIVLKEVGRSGAWSDRTYAEDFQAVFAYDGTAGVVEDATGEKMIQSPYLRVGNKFRQTRTNQSPAAIGNEGPLYFTNTNVTASGGWTGDNWQAPDCVLAVPGRNTWDSTNSCYRPSIVLHCHDIAALLNLPHLRSLIGIAMEGIVSDYQTQLDNLAMAVDTQLLACGCVATGWTSDPYAVEDISDLCVGCGGSWSPTNDVPENYY